MLLVFFESQEKSATNYENLMISTSSENVTTQKNNPASDGAANDDDANPGDAVNTQGEAFAVNADTGKVSTSPNMWAKKTSMKARLPHCQLCQWIRIYAKISRSNVSTNSNKLGVW